MFDYHNLKLFLYFEILHSKVLDLLAREQNWKDKLLGLDLFGVSWCSSLQLDHKRAICAFEDYWKFLGSTFRQQKFEVLSIDGFIGFSDGRL